MAYVGTPSYLGNDVTTLAGILQGESSTAEGQQAVASVMANRLNAGGFTINGNYSGILGVALGTNQFQGQVTNPNATSLSIAQQALNGTLPDNTGGALFYGAPAANNASWLNNLLASGTGKKIGGNTFSDVQGPATAAYQSGNGAITPASATGDSVGINQGDDTATWLSASGQGVGADTPNLTDADFNGLTDEDIFGTAAPASTGAGLLGTTGTSPTGAAGGQAVSTGSGQPVNITDLSGLDTAVSGAGKAAQTGATTAGQDIQQSAGGIAGTAASIANAVQSYASGALVIAALIVLGLIFIAFGLGMFKHNLIPQIA